MFCFNDIGMENKMFSLFYSHQSEQKNNFTDKESFQCFSGKIAVRNTISSLKQQNLLRFLPQPTIGIPRYWCKAHAFNSVIRDPGAVYLSVLSFLASWFSCSCLLPHGCKMAAVGPAKRKKGEGSKDQDIYDPSSVHLHIYLLYQNYVTCPCLIARQMSK